MEKPTIPNIIFLLMKCDEIYFGIIMSEEIEKSKPRSLNLWKKNLGSPFDHVVTSFSFFTVCSGSHIPMTLDILPFLTLITCLFHAVEDRNVDFLETIIFEEELEFLTDKMYDKLLFHKTMHGNGI